jgi:hypothetical protein
MLSVLMLCVAAVTISAQTPMRPGQWEVTTQMQMPNLPVQMPEMKTTQCITEQQLKDPTAGLPNPTGPGGGSNDECKVSDYTIKGNTVTWKLVCTGQQKMSGSGQVTVEGDTYAGTMNMSMPQGDMLVKMSGKRLGECKE